MFRARCASRAASTLVAVSWLGAASLAGCSFLTRSDDLAGTRDAASASDAATASDAVAADAPAGPIDGGSVSDAAWCSQQGSSLLFCEDFDDYAQPGVKMLGKWARHDEYSGKVGLDVASALSPPYSLVASCLDAQTSSIGAAVAVLGADLPGTIAQTLTFAFAVRVDQAATTTQRAQVAGITLGPNGSQTAVFLNLKTSEASIAETVQSTDSLAFHSLSRYLVPGAWTRVVMTLSLGTPSTLAVTFDGTKVTTGDAIVLDSHWSSGTAKIDVGIGYEELGTSGWSIHYDDVAVNGH